MKWHLMYEGPKLGHLLAKHIFLNPYLSKKLYKLVGFQDNNYLWYSDSKLNLHGGYYNEEDMDIAKIYGFNYFNKNLKQWIKNQDILHSKTKKIMQEYRLEYGIENIKKEKLISLIKELAVLRSNLFVYVLSCQPQCTDGFQDELKEIIKKSIVKENFVNERDHIFLKLTMPEKKTFFTEENISWLNILIKSKNGIIPDYLIAEHFKKFSLVPASDRTEPWDLKYFIKKFDSDIKSNEDFILQLNNLVNQYKNSRIDKQNIIKKYNLPKRALDIGIIISEIGYYRFMTSYYGRWIGYYFVMICKYLEKDSLNDKVTFEILSNCNEWELVKFIKEGEIDINEMKNRSIAETILIKNGSINIYFGDEAIKVRKNELREIDYSKINEIKGEIGSLGKVTGEAFVFYWNDDINTKVHNIPENAILIAPQTHPAYLPAMYKAKAFATDEGGVTGHAAIVARELNKPCVIGLHIITKVVKTGDLIEIDANEGIVRILKRK